MQKRETKNVGPIIGTFVVIIVIIGAALYVFASHINRSTTNADISTSTTYVIKTEIRADDIQTLKNDLNNAIK